MQPTNGTTKDTSYTFADKNLHVQQSNTGARPRTHTASGRRKNKVPPPGHSGSRALELHAGTQENRNEIRQLENDVRRCNMEYVHTPPEAPQVQRKTRAPPIRHPREELIYEYKSKADHRYLKQLCKLSNELSCKTLLKPWATVKGKSDRVIEDLKRQKVRDKEWRRDSIKRFITDKPPPPKGMYYETYNRMCPSLSTTDSFPKMHKVKQDSRSMDKSNLPSQVSPQTKIKASGPGKHFGIYSRWDSPSISKAANEYCMKLNRKPAPPPRGQNLPNQGLSTSKTANEYSTKLNRNPAPPLRGPKLPSEGSTTKKIKAFCPEKNSDIYSRCDGPSAFKAANKYMTLNRNDAPPLGGPKTEVEPCVSDFFSICERQVLELLTSSKLDQFNALRGNLPINPCDLYFLKAQKPLNKKLPNDSRSSLESKKGSPLKSSGNSSPKGGQSSYERSQGNKSSNCAPRRTTTSNNSSDGYRSKDSSIPRGYSYSQCTPRTDAKFTSRYKSEKLTLPENNRISPKQNPLSPVPKTLAMNENYRQRTSFTGISAKTKPTTGHLEKTQMPAVGMKKSGISPYKLPHAAATEVPPTEIKAPWCISNEKKEYPLPKVHLSPTKSFLPMMQGEKGSQIARTIPSNKGKIVFPKGSDYFVPNIGHECKQTEKQEQRRDLRKPQLIPTDRKEIRAFLINDCQKAKISEKDRQDFTKNLIRRLYGKEMLATYEEITRNAETRNMSTEILVMLAQLERLKACILRYHSAPDQQSRSKSDTAIAVRKRSVHSLISKNASEHDLLSSGEGTDLSNGHRTESNLALATDTKSSSLKIERDMTGCEMDAKMYADNEFRKAISKFAKMSMTEQLLEVDSAFTTLLDLYATIETDDVKTDSDTKNQQLTWSPYYRSPKCSGVSVKQTGEIKSIKTEAEEAEKIGQGLNDTNMEFSAEFKQNVSKTTCVHTTQLPMSCDCLKIPAKSMKKVKPSGSNTVAPSSPKKAAQPKPIMADVKKSSNYYDLSSEATWHRLTVPRNKPNHKPASNLTPRRRRKKASQKKSKGCHPSGSPKEPRGSGSKNVCHASGSKKSARVLDHKRTAEDQKTSQRLPKQHQNSKQKKKKGKPKTAK